MLLNLLVSLLSVASIDDIPNIISTADTLDVAKVSAQRDAEVLSLSPLRSIAYTKIERLGTIGLNEVLNHFSGVAVKDYGGIGGLKTVSVRNMGASHTAVVYDGIAISDAQNGQVDISRFNLDEVNIVSVAIGAPDEIYQSARYFTSAGILKIENKLPDFSQKSTKVYSRMSFASFNTYNPYIYLKQAMGKNYALSIAANGLFSKGNYPFKLRNGDIITQEHRINSDIKSIGSEANFYAYFGKYGKLKAKANVLASERGLPGSVILYTQNAYERLWDKSVISNLMYDCEIVPKWKFHTDIGFTHSYNRHLNTDPVYIEPQNNEYAQNEYSFAIRTAYTPAPHWKFALAEDFFVNTLRSNIPECPFPTRFSSISALSAQYEREKFRISATLVGTGIVEKFQIGEAPRTPFVVSPMLGFIWNFHKVLYIRASYKDGFRAPTFNDRYYARVGNTKLKPEKARQTNIGLTFSENRVWGSVTMCADGYYNHIKEKIVAIPTMYIWKMRNFGEVAMYGLDLTASANVKLASWLRVYINGNYSLQYALDITNPEAKNYKHQIPYTPRHCGSGNLMFEMLWLNFSYRVNGTGKRYAHEQNIPTNEIEAYADHSISINRTFEFGEKYKIFVGADLQNLTGKTYEIIRYYPMPGRVFRLTLKFNY